MHAYLKISINKQRVGWVGMVPTKGEELTLSLTTGRNEIEKKLLPKINANLYVRVSYIHVCYVRMQFICK